MLFRNEENVKYTFCVPSFQSDIKKNNKAQLMDGNEIKNAICEGTNSRKAIFSITLLSKSSADVLGKSWNAALTNIPNNYWIIGLHITEKEYEAHRKRIGYSDYRLIGTFLHPLRNNIVSCVSANGVELAENEWRLKARVSCIIS